MRNGIGSQNYFYILWNIIFILTTIIYTVLTNHNNHKVYKKNIFNKLFA